MPRAHRITDQYATYFVTCTTVGWVDLFTRKECVEIVLDSLDFCQRNKGMVINAYVIMSNHIHMIVYARENGPGLSSIIRDFKRFTSNQMIKWIKHSRKESRRDWMKVVMAYHAKYNKNNEKFQFWQQYNHPTVCTNSKFTWQKLNYIHLNPVKAGIVENPVDYLWSSARNYAEYDECRIEVELIPPNIDIGYIFQ